jgi:GT2 family glycosyltransferase
MEPANPSWPSVALILVTFNHSAITLDCLKSLAELDYPRERLHVIVVDNASTDDTVSVIGTQYPTVTLITNQDNLGFAEGNNVGLRAALQTDAQYLMLLNNDTTVASEMLKRLIEVAERDQMIGIVTPRIYYFSEPRKIWCAGARLDLRRGQTWRLRAEEVDDGAAEAVHDVDFASGCALCARRAAIEQAGLLDARFFFYWEETEWCVRITRAGYRCTYVPDSHVWHKVSSSIQAGSPRVAYYMTRNGLLFVWQTQHGWRGLVSLSRVLGREVTYITVMTLRPKHRLRRAERDARLHGLLDFLRGRFGKMPEAHVSTT